MRNLTSIFILSVLLPVLVKAGPVPVVFTFPDLLLQRGESVEVPIRLTETASYFGFQMAVELDTTALEIEDVIPGAVTRSVGDLAYAQPQKGRLALSWFDATAHELKAGEPVFWVRIRAFKTVRLREAIRLSKTPLRPEIYTADQKNPLIQLAFVSATTSTGGTAERVFAAANPQPNPTVSGASLIFVLPEKGEVIFQLHDLQGRLVHERKGEWPAGINELQVEPGVFPTSGTYVWHLIFRKDSASGTIIRQ